MTTRILAATIAAATLACAQTPKAAAPAAKTFRTPWGDPDLQGVWSNATNTPLERPAKYAGREFLTPEERKAQDHQTDTASDQRAARGTDADVNGAYNAGWFDRGHSDGRTSLIVDPPDGRIPPLTEEAKQRQAKQRRVVRAGDQISSSQSFAGPEDFELYTRCI